MAIGDACEGKYIQNPTLHEIRHQHDQTTDHGECESNQRSHRMLKS